MKIQALEIAGVYLIEPEPFEDNRGRFWRHFCAEEFAKAGLDFTIRQTNFSQNEKRHTLRGIHYRSTALPESKLLGCVRGAVHNMVVDLRADSPTFLKSIGVELTAKNGRSIFLPNGCGNAFLTLVDDTVIHYYHSSVYKAGVDLGVRYDDPALALKWPASPVVISEKDLSYPPLVHGANNPQ